MTISGSIRANELDGTITLADVLEVFPFENSIDYLELKGSTLRTVLERSAEILSPDPDEEITEGHFMQVSGKYISIYLKSHCLKSPDKKILLHSQNHVHICKIRIGQYCQ